MAVYAFIFPGQGSQAVGMGRDLAAAFAPAREVFEEVDETLKQKLSKLMFEGPAEELTLTENTQPALMAHSLAVLRVLEREGGIALADRAVLVAGHSLGEYSALAAAGAFASPQAARLLRLRGQAMQKAVPAGDRRHGGAARRGYGAARDDLRRGGGRRRTGARGGRAGQRQWRRPGGDFRPQGGGRAGRRDGQRARREARHAAAGLGAVSLRPDGAGGRCAWRRRWGGAAARAAGAAGRQRHGRQGDRSGRHRAACWCSR